MTTALATCLAAVVATAYADVQTVVLKGDPAPEAGAVYRNFRLPVASDANLRRTVFIAKVRGGTVRSAEGVFVEDPAAGGLTIALRGGQAPSGKEFRRFSRPAANVLGDVVFQASLSGAERGVYRNGPANVSIAGTTVPPPANGVLSVLSRPSSADNGDTVFHATISGASTIAGVLADEGIFRCSGAVLDCVAQPAMLELLVLKTDALPDRPGRTICDLHDDVDASSFGIAFRAATKLDCADELEAPLEGVFRLAFAGAIETVALAGEQSNPAPGVGGTTYRTFGSKAAIEDSGIVAFIASTSGVLNTDAVFRCNPALCPIAPAEAYIEQGDADLAGNTVSRFDTVGISDAADVLIYAFVNGPSGRGLGIYLKRDATGLLEKVVVKGDPVPDAAIASDFRRIRRPTISPGGRVAWRAKIKRQIGGGADGVFLFE